MNETDKAVASVADKLGDKALQYLNAMEELTKQYAPDVVDAALAVVQMDALGSVLLLFGIAIIAAVSWAVTIHFSRKLKEDKWNDLYFFGSVIPGAVALTTSGLFLFGVLNVWMWVQIFNPKLYLAYRIFGKLL